MLSLSPHGAKKGWLLVTVMVSLIGLASVEGEATEAVTTAACSIGIGCTLWMIWQLMRYDER